LCLHCQVKASFFLGENRFASGLGKLAAANRWIKIGVTRCRAMATRSSCTGDESAHAVTPTQIGTHKNRWRGMSVERNRVSQTVILRKKERNIDKENDLTC